MPEVEAYQTNADCHPPEPEKPSRWKSALNATKNLAGRTKEGVVGVTTLGIEAARNFDTGEALASARQRVERAATAGRGLAERGMEATGDLREILCRKFEDLRLDEIGSTVWEIISDPRVLEIAAALPGVGGAMKMIESGAGKTARGKELTGMGRVKHGLAGAGEIALDVTGGVKIRAAKIGMNLLRSLTPEHLVALGHALKEKGIAGAETILAIGEQMQTHPRIVGLIAHRLTKGK